MGRKRGSGRGKEKYREDSLQCVRACAEKDQEKDCMMMNNYLIHEIHGVGLVSEIAVPRSSLDITVFQIANTNLHQSACTCGSL